MVILRNHWLRARAAYTNFSLLDVMLRVFSVAPRPIMPGHLLFLVPRPVRRLSPRYRDYREWLTEFKRARPKTHWLLITLPAAGDQLVSWVRHAYFNLANWWDSFVVHRSDVVLTGVKRGEFLGSSDIMLYAAFNQLANIIDVTYAARYINYHARSVRDEPQDPDWAALSKKANRSWAMRPYKNSKLGLEKLYDIMVARDLTDEESRDHITAYSNLFVLYVWWTRVRPARGLAADHVGLTAFVDGIKPKYPGIERPRYHNMDAADRVRYIELSNAEEQQETDWIAEDDAMLAKLVKYRHSI